MKISLLITLLFFSYYSKAQHTKDVYNTKINKVNNANINNSNVNIAKVDSVFIGQVITDRTITSEVYFLGTITKHDLNGIYTTTFRFAPKVNPGAFAINVIIEFDSSFIPWYQGDPPPPYNTLILGQKNVVDIKDDYGYTSNVTPH